MDLDTGLGTLVRLFRRRARCKEYTKEMQDVSMQIYRAKECMRVGFGTTDAGFEYIENVAIKRQINWTE